MKNVRKIIQITICSLAALVIVVGTTAGSYGADKEVAYPERDFRDGKARFYKYQAPDGVTIRYFIMKSSDGVIRAAFDACDVCWREGKGYVQKDDFMICRNCGRRFPSVKINVVTGGCNPGALERNVSNGKVNITTDNILKGKRYFAFEGGRR